jgi:hypothetical protein
MPAFEFLLILLKLTVTDEFSMTTPPYPVYDSLIELFLINTLSGSLDIALTSNK